MVSARVLTWSVLAAVCAACGKDGVHSASPVADRSAGADSVLPGARCMELDTTGACGMWGVSLVQLIARPDLFDRKTVQVIGFVNFEFEGNGLYLSREDWDHLIVRNGVAIELPHGFETDSGPNGKRPNQRYVLVEGVFNARRAGHMGDWSGSIDSVSRLQPWPDRSELKRKMPLAPARRLP